jgi:hypothetical protein
MATNRSITSDAPLKSNKISKLWDQLNNALEYAPKFQNKDRPGVDEKTIQHIESKLGIKLPKEIRNVVKVHDGRDHINYGFTYRLATTDLLPIAKWRPYEKEGNGSLDMLCNCLDNENDGCADKNLCDDFQDHWAAYSDATKNAKKSKTKKRKIEYNPDNDETFQALPCELLIIGEGADDYVEQYLISIRSGRIYLAIHNIPKWKLIGKFADWIQTGVKNAVNDKQDIQEQHDEI